jgi:hypothetical protein
MTAVPRVASTSTYSRKRPLAPVGGLLPAPGRARASPAPPPRASLPFTIFHDGGAGPSLAAAGAARRGASLPARVARSLAGHARSLAGHARAALDTLPPMFPEPPLAGSLRLPLRPLDVNVVARTTVRRGEELPPAPAPAPAPPRSILKPTLPPGDEPRLQAKAARAVHFKSPRSLIQVQEPLGPHSCSPVSTRDPPTPNKDGNARDEQRPRQALFDDAWDSSFARAAGLLHTRVLPRGGETDVAADSVTFPGKKDPATHSIRTRPAEEAVDLPVNRSRSVRPASPNPSLCDGPAPTAHNESLLDHGIFAPGAHSSPRLDDANHSEPDSCPEDDILDGLVFQFPRRAPSQSSLTSPVLAGLDFLLS